MKAAFTKDRKAALALVDQYATIDRPLAKDTADEKAREWWEGLSASQQRDLLAEVDRWINSLDLTGENALPESALSVLQDAYLDGGEEAATLLLNAGAVVRSDFDSLVKLANEDSIAYARARGAEMVGMKWDGDVLIENPNAEWVITETTRNDLRALVTKALEEGWTNEELAQAITDATTFSDYRAGMVARTELAFADSRANMATYRASGVVTQKLWLLSADEPCELCITNSEAGAIPLDQPFPSGDDTTPAHPHCQCDVAPIVAADEQPQEKTA